jgi:homocysteine S-methyltransferase
MNDGKRVEPMNVALREALSRDILVGDGAMGTYLYQIGLPVGIAYEELNLSHPDMIERVHREYVAAGARVIETNTYSASRERLSKYGLEGETETILRRGAEIARQAAGTEAYVLGSVGSIRAGMRKNMLTTQVTADFEQQIGVLADTDIDGILLETFYDYEEMALALAIAKKLAGHLPVICQFAVDDTGRTSDGLTAADAFARLLDAGADAVGFNCRTGPAAILRALEKAAVPAGVPVSVFPNAGIPDYMDGEYRYVSTPEYFAESAVRFAEMGARLIGGCCGTTPAHIQAISGALAGLRTPGTRRTDGREAAQRPETGAAENADARTGERQGSAVTVIRPADAPVPATETPEPAAHPAAAAGVPDRFGPTIVDLVKTRHTVIVELDPPRDLDITRFMRGAEALKQAGADALTMADNSLAVTRMSNMALGHLVKEKVGLRPLVHIACRDRNLIGTQSHLMGLDALGIDHVLAVTGDPAKFGDLPGSSSVYDLTSFEIIRMIKQLNEGIAFSGKPLKQKARFVVGAAFNPNVKHLDKAVDRLKRKVESGADYIMTQPVYDPELMVKVHELTAGIGVPIFIGIMPLASGRNAEYLHNEVPGIRLSDDVRNRMRGLEKEEGRRMGVEIAKELLDAAMGLFHGIYLITPFLFYEMSVELTKYVRQRSAGMAASRAVH